MALENQQHNHGDDCDDCRAAGKKARFLAVEKVVREYEALDWVKEARRDGRLAQHLLNLLRESSMEEDGELIEALAAALDKIARESPPIR